MRAGLLPIGAFARSASLSIGQLRHYHEVGLLTPVHVDESSGYRYYSGAQLLDAEVIRQLRDLDVPIDEVRRILDARDAGVTAAVVAGHAARMTKRLREAERVVARLQALAAEPLALLADRVQERALPDLDVLAHTEVLDLADLLGFFTRTYAALAATAADAGLAVCGPPGAVYPGGEWQPAAVRVTAYLPVVGAGQPPGRTTLPGGRFAVALHEGGFATIGETYRGVGAWLAREQRTAELDIRESYLVGPGQASDESGYRTVIAWPLLDEPVRPPHEDRLSTERTPP